MAVKMNLRIITKNQAADPEIGFLAKSISKYNGCTIAMPIAWELRFFIENFERSFFIEPSPFHDFSVLPTPNSRSNHVNFRFLFDNLELMPNSSWFSPSKMGE